SYALIADGIESTMDVVSSLVVWGGLRVAARPPDESHPYGHGKADSLAGVLVALLMLGAAVLIAVESIHGIRSPQAPPAWYTLAVLAGVVLLKEGMFRWVQRAGADVGSGALRGEAWHHRSDAITSAAAFVGISLALLGGPAFAMADEWAALIACVVIAYNAARLLIPAVNETMDAAVTGATERRVREVAGAVHDVEDVEKCRIRRAGTGLLVEIHIEVDGDLTVRHGHDVAHDVKDALLAAGLGVVDVVVHVEPVPVKAGGASSSPGTP
ncbi:MAG: cation transporter, partial [Gemmatimonadetes bacterium]|nr:cation transporter [Gemmatimonadota bacterium]